MSKKGFKISVYILLALCIAALAVLPKILEKPDGKKQAKASEKDKIVLAEAEVIRAGTLIKSYTTTGSLAADEAVSLKPEVSGKLVRLYFREGQRVSTGTLLAKLNDADLQAQLKKAGQKLDLLAKIEERQKILLQNNNISLEEYEKASSDLEIQKTEIEYIKAQIAKTEIRASFAGIVGLRKVSAGAFIGPSDEITTLQKTDIIKVDFSVPLKYSLSTKPGTIIVFYLPPDRKKFEAEIYASEPNLDESSRTLKLRAKLKNTKNQLLPGTFVEVEIIPGESAKSIMIPSQALIPDISSEKVYIYKDGSAKPVNVKIGIRNEGFVEITDGIKTGDTVITSGIIQLKPGAKVKLTNIK